MDKYVKRQIALGIFTALVVVLMNIHACNLDKEKRKAALASKAPKEGAQ